MAKEPVFITVSEATIQNPRGFSWSKGYEARFNGSSDCCGGATPEEAVGKLVMLNRRLFNLDIEFAFWARPERSGPTPVPEIETENKEVNE